MDQLLHGPLQGGAVHPRATTGSGSSFGPSGPQVDGVVGASEARGGAAAHIVRVKRVDDVDAGGGESAGPGRGGGTSANGGLQCVHSLPQTLHFLTKSNEAEEESEEEQQAEQEAQQPLPPTAAGTKRQTGVVLLDLCVCGFVLSRCSDSGSFSSLLHHAG